MVEYCVQDKNLPTVRDAAKVLHSRISHALLNLALESFYLQVEGCDPLLWLQAQSHKTKNYWRSRDGSFSAAGIGQAISFRGPLHTLAESCHSMAKIFNQSDARVKFYGGTRFGKKRLHDDDWLNFADYRFVLPSVELIQEHNKYWLACHFCSNEQRDELKGILEILGAAKISSAFELPQLKHMVNIASFDGWQTQIKKLLKSIQNSSLKKAVLARKKILLAADTIEPLALLSLASKNAQESYAFAFQNAQKEAYIGISPERLFCRQERKLQSESLAGTRPRSININEDKYFEEQLSSSGKEAYEHQLVSDFVFQQCANLGTDAQSIEKRQILKLAKVQHLRSTFSCTLRDEITDFDILQTLHPTPAMCGFPVEQARAILDDIELFDRGCFTGPVGYLGKNCSEFAAGIRIALVQKNKLSLFAGAGIVEGSSALEEWIETHNKMRCYTDLFTHI